MKRILFFLSFLPAFCLQSQTENCFQRANRQLNEDVKSLPKIKTGDTIPDDFLKKGKQRLQSLLGCQFPDTTFVTIREKEVSIEKIESSFVIVYMSMFYCDMCNAPLEEFAKLKKEYGSKLTILAIMEDNHRDFSQLINTYESEISFIPDAREWIFAHNAGCGVPITFLLNKSKLIKFVKSGAGPDNSGLVNEIKKKMN